MTSAIGPRKSAPSPVARRDPWAVETSHANGHAMSTAPVPLSLPPEKVNTSGSRSAASVSIRAFVLGLVFGSSFPPIIFSLVHGSPFWRPVFFLLTLSLFHFLEFYITALYNPSAATTSAFLLSANGKAYNVAHTLALLECLAHCYFASYETRGISYFRSWTLALGLFLIILGQITRTMAMVHAGSNFNHLVQSRRKAGHVLVTDGIYAWLRHPSYFGFWWWGLGTQLVLGNVICLVGFAYVLWRFFKQRIEKEEEFLVDFFGVEYEQYRKRTRVRIPGIS